jgi:hypothetical protein
MIYIPRGGTRTHRREGDGTSLLQESSLKRIRKIRKKTDKGSKELKWKETKEKRKMKSERKVEGKKLKGHYLAIYPPYVIQNRNVLKSVPDECDVFS